MAKVAGRGRKPLSAERIEYELAVTGGFEFIERGPRAELSSLGLDRVMHPRRSVRVVFVTRPAGPEGGPGFVLASFQIDSMVAYLRNQAEVRREIQSELVRDRAKHRAKRRLRRDEDVWKHAEVLFLELSERSVPHPDGLARMKKAMPTLSIEEIVAHSDKADTRSSFTVVLKVEWDDEHWRRAQFRDEKLDSLGWD